MKVLREIRAYCARHGLDGRIRSVDNLDTGVESDETARRFGSARTSTGPSRRDELSAWIREGKDSGEGLAWIESADIRLRTLEEGFRRGRQLVIRLAGVIDEDQQAGTRQEIGVLAESLRAATTTRIGGGPGSRSGGVWVYCSGSGRVIRVATSREPAGDDPPECPDVVRFLDGLVDAPATGDQMHESVGTFERCIDEVGRAIAELSDARRRLMVCLSRSVIEQSKLQSHVQGFDHAHAPEVIGELRTQRVIYQVTLDVLSRVLQPSLMDFLR